MKLFELGKISSSIASKVLDLIVEIKPLISILKNDNVWMSNNLINHPVSWKVIEKEKIQY